MNSVRIDRNCYTPVDFREMIRSNTLFIHQNSSSNPVVVNILTEDNECYTYALIIDGKTVCRE